MLSYQHIYHAGNAADIHKHLWLVSVLTYLKRKDTPLTWIDTHGGRGLYDLHAAEAEKLREYETGIGRLYPFLQTATALPPALETYRDLIRAANGASEKPRYYPGSALIAAQILAKTDRLHSFDLHPQEVLHLEGALSPYPHADATKADGYEGLKRLLPPPSRRGGALIDPSYEIKTEYALVTEEIKAALQRFPLGVFMIWYPLLPAGQEKTLKTACQALRAEILIDEWIFTPPRDKMRGLYGSGMILINPPYTTPESMAEIKALLEPLRLGEII